MGASSQVPPGEGHFHSPLQRAEGEELGQGATLSQPGGCFVLAQDHAEGNGPRHRVGS